MIAKKSLYTILLLFAFYSQLFAQVPIRYDDYSETWNYSDFLKNSVSGGGYVQVQIKNNQLTLTFTGSFSFAPLKTGIVKTFAASAPLPDLNFGQIGQLTSSASIVSNNLVITGETSCTGFSKVFTVNLDLYTVKKQVYSSSENYLVETVPSREGYKKVSDVDLAEALRTVTYFDGLARAKEKISVGGSPSGLDVVQPIIYDGLGRETYKLLPYSVSDQNNLGRFQSLPDMENYSSSAHYAFYQTQDIASEDKAFAYSRTIYDGSPLNRVIEQGMPGAAWQPIESNNSVAGHSQRADYQTNGANEVLLFTVSGTALSTAIGYYGPTQLNVIQRTDEDGHITKEYKDKQDKVVLKRVFDGTTNLDTYFVYDVLGLLRFVLPPEATNKIAISRGFLSQNETGSTISGSVTKNIYENKSYILAPDGKLTLGNGFAFKSTNFKRFSVISGGKISQTDIDNLVFQYQYDGRRRMTVKKIPGADPVYLVYDYKDRLVLTQDGELRKGNKWNFIKYDLFNRPAVTGIYLNSLVFGQPNMQSYISNSIFPSPPAASRELYVIMDKNTSIGYSDTSFPKSTDGVVEYLTATYYDNYDFNGVRAFDTSANSAVHKLELTSYFDKVKGLVTGTKEKVLNSSFYLTSTNYYDKNYRVIQSLKDLYDGTTSSSYEVVANAYDYLGNVKQRRQIQNFTNSSNVLCKTAIDNYYVYDHAARLTKTQMQIDGDVNGKITTSDLTYNEIGQLVDKKLHKTATGTFNQSVDYKYNIRGWLTGINDIGASQGGDPYADLFAERLHYNTVESITLQNGKLYNGNISAQVWSSNGKIQAYQYAYDDLNRIKDGDYKTYSGVWTDASKYDERVLEYDFNGNIKILTRTDELGATTGVNGAAYTNNYNGNQLKDINGGAAYGYDANGNMTADGRTGNVFAYNVLNLPQKVTKGVDYINYTYSATGQKLLKNYNGASNQYYAGNMVYSNTKALDYIIFEEGVIRKVSGGYSWEYNLKDHLGNTRVVFRPMAGEAPKLKQICDYYPFGQTFAPIVVNESEVNKYLYNGKELQDDKLAGSSLNMLDYGARFYDAAIGRWHSIDPLSEMDYSGSVYSYVCNSPINLIDPDGRYSVKPNHETILIPSNNDGPVGCASTHTDENGTVLAVYDDGDLGVYVHLNGTLPSDIDKTHSKSNTSAGGTKKGETYYWDEFRAGDRILFNQSWKDELIDLANDGCNEELPSLMWNSRSGKKFDIKSGYPQGTGKMLGGKYISAESAGNFLAGFNAGGRHALTFLKYMKLAGAYHISGLGGLTSTIITSTPAGQYPWFGEVDYAGRMIVWGWLTKSPQDRQANDVNSYYKPTNKK